MQGTIELLATTLLLASCAAPGPAPAVADEPYTVFIALDDASVASVGRFPVDREVYARAIRKARELGARGLALKFFIDQPSNPRSDRALAQAVASFPVLMQFSSTSSPSRAPRAARRLDWDLSATREPLRMTGALAPLPALASHAAGLGFVESRSDGLANTVEVAGLLGSEPVASLQLAIAELALGHRAVVRGNRLRIGSKDMDLDEKGRVACPVLAGPEPRMHGIGELLAGTIPRREIRGKVVVLGYARSDSPTIEVAGRALPIHAFFYRDVACLVRLLGTGTGSGT